MTSMGLESCDYHVTTVCRDVDETKSWMNEKDTALLSDDYGRDLASVQALQRKHEGLERDLAALEDKVRSFVLPPSFPPSLPPSLPPFLPLSALIHVPIPPPTTFPPSLSHGSLQVSTLGDEARRLQSIHSDSSDQIAAKQAEIVGLWEGLKRKASQRGTRLADALCFQKFLADCR